jgi:hypothetical protein
MYIICMGVTTEDLPAPILCLAPEPPIWTKNQHRRSPYGGTSGDVLSHNLANEPLQSIRRANLILCGKPSKEFDLWGSLNLFTPSCS